MSKKIQFYLLKYSRLLVLIVLFIFFSISTETFWSIDSWSNVANIVLQQAPFTILLAVCMTIVIILKGFDLSIGSAIAFVSCVTGIVLNRTGGNVVLALIVSVVLGAAIYLLEAFFITYVKVNTFVVTFSMQWILRGFAMVLLGGKQIYDLGTGFRSLFISNRYTFLGITIVICAVVTFILRKTVFGREVYAVGKNEVVAEMSGMRNHRVYIISFLLIGVVIGLTSALYIANLGTAEPTIGSDFPMTAIAATLVGGTAVAGGEGGVFNAVIGSFILLVLTNGMIHMGVPSTWQQVAEGAVIILSVVSERGLLKLSKGVENV